jgi:transposase-like protein
MTNSSSNASDESNVEKSVKKDKETLKIEFLRDFSNDYFPE